MVTTPSLTRIDSATETAHSASGSPQRINGTVGAIHTDVPSNAAPEKVTFEWTVGGREKAIQFPFEEYLKKLRDEAGIVQT